MSSLPPPRPPQPPTRTMTDTIVAVTFGVVCGVVGLIVLAVLLAGRSGGDWAGLIILGLVILAAVEGNNYWRKKQHRR